MSNRRVEFLKSIDRYGNPVLLNYNGQGSFPTRGGGIATIFTAILLTYWVCSTFAEQVTFP